MPLVYTPDLLFEGFSLSRAVLLDSVGNEIPDGVLYGARSVNWDPEIESFDEFSHDKLINVWSDVRRVNFTLEAGFTSLAAWAKVTGATLDASGSTKKLLLWEAGRSNTIPYAVKMTFPARDAAQVARTVALTLFRVKFKPPKSSGSSYKDGQSVTFEGTALLSPTDETGVVLAREAFGRLDRA